MRRWALIFFLFCLRLNALTVTSQTEAVYTNAPPPEYSFPFWISGNYPFLGRFNNGDADSAWVMMGIGPAAVITARHAVVVVRDANSESILYEGTNFSALDLNGYWIAHDVNIFQTATANGGVTNPIGHYAKVFTNFVTSEAASGIDFRYTNTPSLSTAEFLLVTIRASAGGVPHTPKWASFTGAVMAAVSGEIYVYPKVTFDGGNVGFTVEAGDSGGPVFIRTQNGWEYFAHVRATTGGTGGIFAALWTGQSTNQPAMDAVADRVAFDGSGNSLYSGGGGGGGSPPNLPERKISFRVRR